MPTRPTLVVVAIGLTLLIGLSGLLVGIGLLGSMLGSALATPTGALIGGVMAGYGLLLTAAAVGLILRRRYAFGLAVGGILAGLVFLIGLVMAVGPDPVLASGVAIWAVTLGCLVGARPAI